MANRRKSPTRARRRPHEYDHEYGLRRKNPTKANRDPEVFPGRD